MDALAIKAQRIRHLAVELEQEADGLRRRAQLLAPADPRLALDLAERAGTLDLKAEDLRGNAAALLSVPTRAVA